MCGCASGTPETSSEPALPVPAGSASNGYVFITDGATIAIDEPAAGYIDKLGEPLSYFEASSCAFGEQDKVWTYPGFRIDTYQLDGEDYVMDVVLTDDTVMTSEGIRIGDHTDDITAAYGDPTESGDQYVLYEKDDMKLVFILDGDHISVIEYLSKKLD